MAMKPVRVVFQDYAALQYLPIAVFRDTDRIWRQIAIQIYGAIKNELKL